MFAQSSTAVEDDFLLKDTENEEKYGMSLDESLERARGHKGKLFAGLTFLLTPKVPLDAKLLKNVVTAGGGQVTQLLITACEQHPLIVCLGCHRCYAYGPPAEKWQQIRDIVCCGSVYLEIAQRARNTNL